MKENVTIKRQLKTEQEAREWSFLSGGDQDFRLNVSADQDREPAAVLGGNGGFRFSLNVSDNQEREPAAEDEIVAEGGQNRLL